MIVGINRHVPCLCISPPRRTSPCTSKTFSILPCPEDFSHDFLQELFLYPPLLYRANLSLSGDDQIIDSPGGVPRFESEAVDLIHGEPCLHFRPSILVYTAWIGLQTVNNLFVHQGAISYDIPLQRVLVEQLYLLEQPDPLAIQGDRGFLDAQKESFLFQSMAPAQDLNLDSILSCLSTASRVSPY